MSRVQRSTTLALVCLLLVGVLPLSAQDEESFGEAAYTEDVTNAGTSAAAFLEIGVGASPQALGGAYTALARDATALYWNPAGITQVGQISVSANHTQWLAGTSHQFFGLVLPFGGRFVTGLSVNSLNYAESQPVRTIQLPEGTGEFYSASDLALAATMAASITDRFSFGFSAKYILQQLWHESASAVAIDLGVLYQTRIEGLQIGTIIANYGSDLQMAGRDLREPYDADPEHYSNDRLNVMMETDQFSLPLLFRFGLAYTYTTTTGLHLTVASDLNHPSNNVESMNIGMELGYQEFLVARVGYESLFDDNAENGLTAGFGIMPSFGGQAQLGFNYAWSAWGLLGNVQRFSIDLLF